MKSLKMLSFEVTYCAERKYKLLTDTTETGMQKRDNKNGIIC